MNTVSSCVDCGYPVGIKNVGQQLDCPMCGITQEAVNTTPATLILAGVSFIFGLVLGVATCKTK